MDDIGIRIIKALQNGISVEEQPFARIAEKAGVSEEEVLARIETWKSEGVIRRFGAVLRHQQAGISSNAMVVWNVPDDGVEKFGRIAAEHQSVSHCYQRPRFGNFKYNLYTMVHGKTEEDIENAVAELSARTGISDFDLLYTTAEYKKSSPVYY